MPRYLAICSYDGTHYKGFQKQIDGGTIQDNIEDALSKLLNVKTIIHASGRTDAQVHAYNQTFHFDTIKELDTTKFIHSMNCLLNDDIHIKSLKEVDSDFHARISAKKKHYRYVINMGEKDPFYINYHYQLNKKLDVDKIKEASKLFIGEHNFQDFTSKEEDFSSFIRTIDNIEVNQVDDILIIDFYGNGFMRYMIRMIVGTLLEIGLDKEDYSFIEEHLDKKERRIISYKAPGNGLYLVEVIY